MKVKELIEELQQFGNNMEVSINGPDGWGVTDTVSVQLIPILKKVNKELSAGEHGGSPPCYKHYKYVPNGERVYIHMGDVAPNPRGPLVFLEKV